MQNILEFVSLEIFVERLESPVESCVCTLSKNPTIVPRTMFVLYLFSCVRVLTLPHSSKTKKINVFVFLMHLKLELHGASLVNLYVWLCALAVSFAEFELQYRIQRILRIAESTCMLVLFLVLVLC